MLAYHDVSSAPTRQRQSATCEMAHHTGRPVAPATCAIALSIVITTSSSASAAAVSARSTSSLARSCTCGNSASAATASPFCSDTKLTPGTDSSSRSALNGIERWLSRGWLGLPAQTRPTRGPGSARTLAATGRSVARRYPAASGTVSSVVPMRSAMPIRRTCRSAGGSGSPSPMKASMPGSCASSARTAPAHSTVTCDAPHALSALR